MVADWPELAGELAAWRDAGRRATVWWRDDDASAPSPALDRLLGLAAAHELSVALAVIPRDAGAALPERLAAQPRVAVLQHGLAHLNHAPPTDKKAEFGAHRPLSALRADAEAGRQALLACFGPRALPVFVPPWNRMNPRLIPLLPQLGLRGLSRFRPRAAAEPAPGLREANCHVDPVDWRGNRGFVGVAAVLDALCGHLRARREGGVDAAEPTGLLTHHAVTDEDGWRFLDRLLGVLAAEPAVHWLSADDVFRVAP